MRVDPASIDQLLHPSLDPSTIAWLWKWWRACGTRRHQANRRRMQRLALFSRERLHGLTHDLHLEYERREGYLVLLRGAGKCFCAGNDLAGIAAGATPPRSAPRR